MKIIFLDSDPRLIDVSASIKALQREYDDCVWENGYNHALCQPIEEELERLKKLELGGITVEPTF